MPAFDDEIVEVEEYPNEYLSSPVPYRVVQKRTLMILLVRAAPPDFNKKAPAVLGLKKRKTVSILDEKSKEMDDFNKLNLTDEVFVESFQYTARGVQISKLNAEEKLDPSNYYSERHECYYLEPLGTIWKGFVKSRATISTELWFISSYKVVDSKPELRVAIMDKEMFVPCELLNVPVLKRKPGTLVRVHFVLLPANSRANRRNDVVLHEKCTKEVCLPNLKLAKKSFLKMFYVELVSNPEPKEFPQHLTASMAMMKNIYRQDLEETISSTLDWRFTARDHAIAIYCVDSPIEIGQDHLYKNYRNSLFRRNSIVVLRRDGLFKKVAHVKVTSATYREEYTRVVFEVDPLYLLEMWELDSEDDLRNGKYQLEPADLFWYITDFIEKIRLDPSYLSEGCRHSGRKENILAPFIPIVPKQHPERNNKRRRNSSESSDDSSGRREWSLVQEEAIKAISDGKPFVIVDGAAKTGKSMISRHSISQILSEQVCIGRSNCLFVTGNLFHLDKLYYKLKKQKTYASAISEHEVKVLSFLDLQCFDPTNKESLTGCINEILERYKSSILYEDEKMFRKILKVFKSGVLPQKTDKVDGEIDIAFLKQELEDLSLGDRYEVEKKKKEWGNRHFTSAEFDALKTAVRLIFKYYCPNLVFIDRLTLVSLLPVIQYQITHLFVEGAGVVPLFDVLAIVRESERLRQTVVIGDRTQCPTHRRIRIPKIPKFFQSIMNGIDLERVEYFQLKETFNLNRGIMKILNQVFYSNVELCAKKSRKLSKCEMIEDSCYPMVFYDVVGHDEWVYPTTRCNPEHSKMVRKLINKLYQYDKTLTIDILCYYAGQANDIQYMLKHHKNPKVRIRCVDSIYDEGADVVIVVTTRTLDQRMFPPEYKESTRNGERYVKRVLVDQEKVKNKFCAETYRFVFDKQRMLLALSRAEKACFIIGSYELLREDPNWDHVLNLIAENGNLKEQPELLTDSHGRLKTIADDVQRVVDEPIEVIQIDDEGNDMDSSVEISVITTKKPKL